MGGKDEAKEGNNDSGKFSYVVFLENDEIYIDTLIYINLFINRR